MVGSVATFSSCLSMILISVGESDRSFGTNVAIEAGPGDFVYVPAWVPHREENPSPDEDAVVVLARSTPEEIVVNLPDLRSVDGIPGAR